MINKIMKKIIKNILTIIVLYITASAVYTKDVYIKKIEVHGLTNYTKKYVISQIITSNPTTSEEIFDKLIRLRKFSQIKLIAKKKKIILILKEYPKIENIQIYGDESEKIYAILKKRKININNVLVPQNLQLFKYNLKKKYNNAAFFNFDLKINLDLNKKTNTIKIKINFKKNDVFSIKKIFAYGINSKHGKEIMEGFIARNTSWFPILDKKDIYAKQIMDRELQFIKDNYLFNGHLDFYIKSGKLIINKQKSEIVILLDIHEGRQYKIRDYVVKNESKENAYDPEIVALMTESFKKGDIFDSNEATLLQRKIEMYFHYKGFLEVKPELEPIMAGEDLIDLVVTFQVKKRPIINSIQIKHNKKATDFLLRKLTKQMEKTCGNGLFLDLVRRDLIKFTHATELKYSIEKYKEDDYIKKLLNNNQSENPDVEDDYDDDMSNDISPKERKKAFIEEAEMKLQELMLEEELNPDEPEQEELSKLVLTVKEKNLNKFMAGGNYKTGLGISVHAGTDLINFLGTGNDLTIKIKRSRKMTEVNFGFIMQDYFTGDGCVVYNLYYKTDIFHQKDTEDDDDEKGKIEYGFFVSKSIDFNSHSKLTLQFACDKAEFALPPFRTTMFIQDYSDKWNVSHREEYVMLLHVYDSLDFPELPNKGILSKLTFKLQLPSSDVNYYILNWEIDVYKEIKKDLVLHFNFNFIHGDIYYNDDEEEVEFPFFRNFYFTGKGKIRGYADQIVGPKDIFFQPIGGNTLFSLKTSLYFPISYLEELYIFDVRPSIFFDVGQIYNTHEYPDEPLWMDDDKEYSSFLRFSIGIEFLWASPVGLPVELTFAHALNPNEIEDTEIISLRVINNKVQGL